MCVFFFIIYFSFSRSPVDAIDIFGKTPPLRKVKGENLGYTQCAAAQCVREYTATAAVPLTGTFFFLSLRTQLFRKRSSSNKSIFYIRHRAVVNKSV